MSSEAGTCPSLEFDCMATIQTMTANEAYTGALAWGTKAKVGAPPVRAEDTFPAIVTGQAFWKAGKMQGSGARIKPARHACASACPRIVLSADLEGMLFISVSASTILTGGPTWMVDGTVFEMWLGGGSVNLVGPWTQSLGLHHSALNGLPPFDACELSCCLSFYILDKIDS